jgi:chromate transport protein ChrA
VIDGLGLISEAVFVFGLGPRTGASEPMGGLLLGLGLVASAIVLILGLRTFFAGNAAAVLTLGSALYTSFASEGTESWRDVGLVLCAVVFVLSTSLALLGPGGYSLEARLSGWKVIKLSSRKSNSGDAQ